MDIVRIFVERVVVQMDRLKKLLERIDGRGYKAYKDIQGSYRGDWFQLHIDHVQGDPFASPSRIRLVVPQTAAKIAPEWFSSPWRKIACEDFLTRQVFRSIRNSRRHIGGTGKSGLIAVDAPGQEMLLRTSVKMDERQADIRLSVGLPAAGRTILGKQAAELLCSVVPTIVREAVLHFPRDELARFCHLADQQQAIREYMAERGYVAFVADGSILPRESGESDRPLQKGQVVPFQSPPSLRVEIPVPHGEPISGMAISRGITLIVGGGYHGKSTLLKAIERGVYNHIPGDGREYVLTDPTAVKIRAEDGRRVEKVNISPFISNLPFGQDTSRFSSDDASGSTSQAANIMESLELGARTLLIDEDTSATNFMIRDARMQSLVAKGKEPITPFVDKVRQLYEDYGVSSILVIGGSGDYFDVADRVIMMDEYRPRDVTDQAKQVASAVGSRRRPEGGEHFGEITSRIVAPDSLDASRGGRHKAEAKGLRTILYGKQTIDLSLVEQLVDPSQTRAIALMLPVLAEQFFDGKTTLRGALDRLYEKIAAEGLDIISPYRGRHPGDLALPRKFEAAAAINRLRSLLVCSS
jgi:predicted ABC-class ATPase